MKAGHSAFLMVDMGSSVDIVRVRLALQDKFLLRGSLEKGRYRRFISHDTYGPLDRALVSLRFVFVVAIGVCT